MEKSYSVAVEMSDGEKKTLIVSCETTGAAFQQVKAMPGVRRVGKVSEITSSHRGVETNHRVEVSTTSNQPVEREQKADERRAAIGFAISGPRVVMRDRQTTGERPFKNLYVPPERLKAPAALIEEVVIRSVEEAPVQQADRLEETSPTESPRNTEYRIIKSRRRDGQPFLLQRGSWSELHGKRSFVVAWEKGFEVREQAERHQEWVRQTEQELAEVESQN